jgi:hypothetical protein
VPKCWRQLAHQTKRFTRADVNRRVIGADKREGNPRHKEEKKCKKRSEGGFAEGCPNFWGSAHLCCIEPHPRGKAPTVKDAASYLHFPFLSSFFFFSFRQTQLNFFTVSARFITFTKQHFNILKNTERVCVAVALKTCVLEVLVSNLGRDTGCHDSGFSWISSVAPCKSFLTRYSPNHPTYSTFYVLR